MKLISDIKKFWETCPAFYAHFGEEQYRKCLKPYSAALSMADLNGATVIDYGCGGGQTGKMLFDHGIKKYIGIDIAERSIRAAQKLLTGYNSEFYLLPVDLKKIDADVLTCISVIHHMPKNVFIQFIDELNERKFDKLILQIRPGKTKFRDQYSIGGNVGLCCITNEPDMTKRLKNYRLVNQIAGSYLYYEAK